MNETEKDATGRTLTFRKLGVLDQMRLLRAIGPAQADNQPYCHMVFAAAAVGAIDGVPKPMPTNERTIDGLVGELGDAGMAVAQIRVVREMQAAMEAAQKAMADHGEDKKSDPLAPSA